MRPIETKRIVTGPKDGFSLVEVMVALAIFVIVAASGFSAIKMGLSFAENARHHTRAGQAMQSEVENIRSLAWADLKSLPSEQTRIELEKAFGESSYTDYTLFRSIEGSGDTRKISLELSWVDMSGRTFGKTYVTQYTKGGLYDYIN